MKKMDFPVEKVRRYLEPGPVVLVSSAWKGKTDIMTMGWHTVMEFSPSLIGACIAPGNFTQDLVLKSKECVINVPGRKLANQVVGIGNCTGRDVDKFKKFRLTPGEAEEVGAPLIEECFANFECRVVDTKMVPKYFFFVLEVVKAHVSVAKKIPPTIHYRGNGEFMVAGPSLNLRRKFRPEMLD